jgi:DNA-binding transcriptional LysR family regulator
MRRISSFESKKGVQVFERTGGGYLLTPEARHLLAPLRAIDDQVNALDRSIARLGLELDGPVRITTSDTIALASLARHVADFQSRHKGTNVELNINNSYVDFKKMEADITVRPANALPPDLVGQHACDILLHVYATPSYLEGNRRNSYSAHRWLGVAPPLTATMVGDWERRNIPGSAIMLKSNSFVGLQGVAETGLGLALLPCCLGDPSPNLVRADCFPEALSTSIWVATHKDMIGSVKVQSVMSWFVQAIGKDADLFEGRWSEPVRQSTNQNSLARMVDA